MDEKKIAHFMESLDLTREEAIELIESDNEIDHMKQSEVNSDLTKEQQKVVKKMKNIGQKTTVSTKSATRERKVDEDKNFLIDLLKNSLAESVENLEQTKSAEMEFSYNGRKFKIVLSAPRK